VSPNPEEMAQQRRRIAKFGLPIKSSTLETSGTQNKKGSPRLQHHNKTWSLQEEQKKKKRAERFTTTQPEKKQKIET